MDESSITSGSYKHKPLDQPDKQIRLFYLEKHHECVSGDPLLKTSPKSAQTERRISGRLEHVSLEEHPEYVALSYTWGDAEKKNCVAVDGFSFEVTANLFAVLEVLADVKELRGRPLWIDAICINQKDDNEKNLQVPLMGRIYSQANEVFAWVGPEADGSADVLDALDLFGGYWLRLREKSGDDRRSRNEVWSIDVISEKMNVLERLMGSSCQGPTSQTLKVLERPWWHRVWVIQEVTLARAAFIMCGTRFFSWKNIMGTFHIFSTSLLGIQKSGPWSGMKALYSPVEHFFVLWNKCGRGQLSTQAVSQERSGDSRRPPEVPRGQGLSLEELLEYLVFLEKDTFQASNEKDRVYAFRAFLSQGDRALLGVDYSKNTKFSDIMETITWVMFQRYGPRILSFRRPLSPESQDLPSWYIDWTRIRSDLAMYDPTCAADFAAAGKESWRFRPCQTGGNPTQLPLEGIKISTVGKLAISDIGVTLSKNPKDKETGNEAELQDLWTWVEMMSGLLENVPDDAPKSSSKANLCLVATAGDQTRRWSERNVVYEAVPESQGRWECRLLVTHRPFEEHDSVVENPLIKDYWFRDTNHNFDEIFRLRWSLHKRFEVLMGGRAPKEEEADTDDSMTNWIRYRGKPKPRYGLESEDGIPKFTWEYWRRLQVNGHKGFVTPDGRAGLGPRAMKSDDLVVIFKGCEFPFIIRPRCKEKSEYELVGACYVDGIMMGEAMEANPSFEQMFLV